MNSMKDRRKRGVAWWTLAALMLVGVAEAMPTGVGSPWLPRPHSGSGVEVVIVCDSGRGLLGQTHTPPGIHTPVFGQPRPWAMTLPQMSRFQKPLNSVLPAGFGGAPLSQSQLRLGVGMARGCRPVVIMPGLPVR